MYTSWEEYETGHKITQDWDSLSRPPAQASQRRISVEEASIKMLFDRQFQQMAHCLSTALYSQRTLGAKLSREKEKKNGRIPFLRI